MSESSIRALEPNGYSELDFREADGISVALCWSRTDDQLAVIVEDTKEEVQFKLPVTPETAQEVFQHPYAYAALSSEFVGRLPDFPQIAAA